MEMIILQLLVHTGDCSGRWNQSKPCSTTGRRKYCWVARVTPSISIISNNGATGCSVKKDSFWGQFWAKNTKLLSFWCPVTMATIFLDDVSGKWVSGRETAFLTPKKATLGNRSHKTARRAAERPPTGKPRVSRVTSGYGGDMMPLSRVRPSPRKEGYMGVA